MRAANIPAESMTRIIRAVQNHVTCSQIDEGHVSAKSCHVLAD
jgi:hypothetical protein